MWVSFHFSTLQPTESSMYGGVESTPCSDYSSDSRQFGMRGEIYNRRWTLPVRINNLGLINNRCQAVCLLAAFMLVNLLQKILWRLASKSPSSLASREWLGRLQALHGYCPHSPRDLRLHRRYGVRCPTMIVEDFRWPLRFGPTLRM